MYDLVEFSFKLPLERSVPVIFSSMENTHRYRGNTLQKLIIYTKNIKNNDVFNVLNMSGFNLTFFEENEDAEEESGSESADEGPPEKSQKTAKKVYAQQFRHQWLCANQIETLTSPPRAYPREFGF